MLDVKFSIAVLFGALGFLVNGCYPPKQMELSIQNNGQEIKVKKGQPLIITLEGNPTTGYTWTVAEPTDTQILRQVGEIEFNPQSDLLGAPGVQVIRFEVMNKGGTTLKLVYHRPWEKEVEPLKTFSIKINAR